MNNSIDEKISQSVSIEHKILVRKIEIFFFVFTLLLFILIAYRYIIYSDSTRQFITRIENSKLIKLNNEHTTNKSNGSNKEKYLLKYINGSGWGIYKDDLLSGIYKIENINNKVAIRNTNNNLEGFNVEISGVRSYFDRNNLIVTDIPYNNTNGNFKISVQEDLFPIFGYHNVYENDLDIKDPRLDIRKNDFEEQLKTYNEKLNCRWLTFSEITSEYITKEKKIPRNACVMTFDDGRKNNYEIVYPLLKKYNIKASFYIVAGRIGEKKQMNNSELSILYRSGNEIGSHALTGGSMVNTEWFKGIFAEKDLLSQIKGSKDILDELGYNVSTFAYPIGDFNDRIVSFVRNSGYGAARATLNENQSLNQRTIASEIDNSFIWTLNYFKPELYYPDEIVNKMKYDGLWQFEEGFSIINNVNNNIKTLSQNIPTKDSYEVISLPEVNNEIANSFILDQDGSYIIDIMASTSTNNENGIQLKIDNIEQKILKDSSQSCTVVDGKSYCHYLAIIERQLTAGKHIIDIKDTLDHLMLDYFSIQKNCRKSDTYDIEIENFR